MYMTSIQALIATTFSSGMPLDSLELFDILDSIIRLKDEARTVNQVNHCQGPLNENLEAVMRIYTLRKPAKWFQELCNSEISFKIGYSSRYMTGTMSFS